MKRTNHRTRPAGFTLVEMLVAIGIIVVMLGVTISAASSLAERSAIRETENTLRLIDMAFQEWELTADRKLTWGAVEGQSDVWSQRRHKLIISEMLDVIRRHPRAAEILARIDPRYVHTYRTDETPAWIEPADLSQLATFAERESITILDAWGFPIYATHPGSLDPAVPPADPDGTINTWNEKYFGSARDRRICFVAAGPDRAYGRVNAGHDSTPYQQTLDNVYSYAIERPSHYD